MNRLHPFAQLIRLPNVFTALADICLGALVTGALPGQWLAFILLLGASACLYSAGMVWNDFFDLEQDRKERPFRPLPSGKIPLATAARLGVGLLAAGFVLAALVDLRGVGFRGLSASIAACLIVAILLYDGWLKRTWAGPLSMGLCRALNVLLGLSVAPAWVGAWGLYLALVVGVYIVGVTWFARTEARVSNQHALMAAAGVLLASLLLALALPVLGRTGGDLSAPSSPARFALVGLGWLLFPYLLVGLGFLVGIPVCRAINRPVPERVQAAVKRAIMGLVLLDAVLATALAGTVGLTLVALLVPALYMGRWVYST
jgi:4-hydroxybenzoate polyprenyltransferase